MIMGFKRKEFYCQQNIVRLSIVNDHYNTCNKSFLKCSHTYRKDKISRKVTDANSNRRMKEST